MMPIPANPTNASIQPQSLYDAWADLAWRAMLTEVNLSPKPGLVDRLNWRRAQRYGAGGFSPQRGGDSTLAAALYGIWRQLHAPAARVSSGGPASIGDGL
ncbi:Triphosphoribosyl-dephospho-CoA [Salmonella enterica subsp. enterica]|uniref:Triphosphoribosyl-dephospho-CoA n=1 Tax=Salmonella enterica I TaxID=59201 RepID=A0A447MW84_SALET|nr:Triphosphoribosyl-dephospho-CoA [Salmonella enterica subsp. enterica]